MNTTFDNKFVSINIDQILFCRWKSATTDMDAADFQACLLEVVNLVKENKPIGLLGDNRNFNFTINLELQKWHDEIIVNQYLENGLGKLALLHTEDFIAQISIEQMARETDDGKFKIHFFDNEAEALSWLKG